MQMAARLGGALLVLWLFSSTVSCIDYDYTNGPNGPANWGNLPDSATCATGTLQSPINITKPLSLVIHKPLKVHYTKDRVNSTIYNNGHTPTVEILERDVAVLNISGVKYELKDFHFHIPSEHKILNQSFAAELHLVHVSADRKIAVIGLLYKLGWESAFLAQFFGNLPGFSPPNVRRPIRIKLPSLHYFSYYRYNGSLTTPPCSEGVTWTVLSNEENARPIQARNGRTIYLATI